MSDYWAAGVDGNATFALAYNPEEEGFQAFEVLQQWTPQVIGAMAQAGTGDGATGILSPDGQHIIVHTITVRMRLRMAVWCMW